MSAVTGSYNYEMDASYAADFSRDREPVKTRSRHPEYRRKGSAPTRVNGMHCRRNKRWSWGSGRGARMANLRAFASCVAVAVAALASNAFAVSFNWAQIPQASGSNVPYLGNPGFPSGIGSVNYGYQMSKTETTRGQYTDFLNAVASSTSAPTYVQALFSGSTNFGITRTLSSGSYVYSTTSPQNPVTAISWTSAARFVNWLNAGQPTVTSGSAQWNSALNTGAYTISSGSTGSTVVARNPGYTTAGNTPKYFLPSANEWVKAAYFNPNNNTYNTWATGVSGTATPSSTSVASSGSNTAVFNTGVSVPNYAALPVGSIPNTQSPYGLFDMLGNVTEMTDTGNVSGAWFSVSGNYSLTTAQIANWTINRNSYLTTVSQANGFRVAGIAAVPEPETITLAAFGIVGLCGANWLKRRRKVAAPAAEAIVA
jgi:formylglycine-generating enzyme required for sulfatase activity